MSKVPSIGAGVITTDDVLAQGYDFVPLPWRRLLT